jgi:hypothetical protein
MRSRFSTLAAFLLLGILCPCNAAIAADKVTKYPYIPDASFDFDLYSGYLALNNTGGK